MLNKTAWLALAMPGSGIAFQIEIAIEEKQSWENWRRRRGFNLLGVFSRRIAAVRVSELWQAQHVFDSSEHQADTFHKAILAPS